MTLVKLLDGQETNGNRKILDLLFEKLYGTNAMDKAKGFNEVMVPQFKALLANRDKNLRIQLNRSFDQLMDPHKVAQQNEPVSFQDIQMLAAIIDEGIPASGGLPYGMDWTERNEDDFKQLEFSLKAIYLDAYIDTLSNQSEEIFNEIASARMSKIIQPNQGPIAGPGGRIIMP